MEGAWKASYDSVYWSAHLIYPPHSIVVGKPPTMSGFPPWV